MPEIDWFASQHNAKLPLFFSRFWNPKSSGVDAYTEFWGRQFGLFLPPINLISRVLNKVSTDCVGGVLVVPMWKSALYWPLLCHNGQFISAVIDWVDLPTNKECYVPCKNGNGIFGNENLRFRMLALNLSFKYVSQFS